MSSSDYSGKVVGGVGREGEGVRVLGRDIKGWGEFFFAEREED